MASEDTGFTSSVSKKKVEVGVNWKLKDEKEEIIVL